MDLVRLHKQFPSTFGTDPSNDKFVAFIQCEKGCDA